jgi:hypothetical protein
LIYFIAGWSKGILLSSFFKVCRFDPCPRMLFGVVVVSTAILHVCVGLLKYCEFDLGLILKAWLGVMHAY